MYLKKIIAQGFKSFADNTVIDLDNNIAGIVGPNGSGKSNVVDAVRWVLGEQSVKSLRGDSSMTDVIFSGSKSRGPMNSATVTLVFDNSDNYLNISYDEVEVKRKLYKDGTNEFYLNGEKVRLKDINEILMDSGIAKEAFNIISQGKIDDILSSKPEDRRVVFEEAAGVLKYKKRKEEALRKLDKTHDNMDRVKDIINELEKEIEPLREQKIKAEEYINLNEELKDLEISLIASDITNINYKYQENKDKMEQLKDELVSLSTSNNTNEAKSVSYKLKINDIDKKLSELNHQLLDQIKNVEQINAKKQIILERKKYKVEDSKLHENLINLKEEELKLNTNINKLKNDIKVKQNGLDNILKDINDIDGNIIKIKNDKSNIFDKLNNTIKNINILNIKINSLKESIDNNLSMPISVKNVLENPKLRGINNTIGSLIEVIEKYSKAISTTLGQSINNIVVDNELCAKEAIEYLKNNNLGRVTFFPLNIIKEKIVDTSTLNILKNENGFIDIASNLVKYDKKYENIIKNQLGNVIVALDIDSANIISKKINYKYRIVTLDGEVLHVGGSLTGGQLKFKNVITDKYDLENNLKLQDKLLNEQKLFEEDINKLDYELKALEDKLYVLNKDKISISEYISVNNNSIKEQENKLDNILSEIKSNNNALNKVVDDEENIILNKYYEALDTEEKTKANIEILKNDKLRLVNELEEFEHKIKKDSSIYNEKDSLLHEIEIEVNRADVKLDNLLNTLNETYTMTYENAIKFYKLDIDPNIARNKVSSLKHKIKDLGPVNIMAKEEYEKVKERYEFLIHQEEDLKNAESTLLEIINNLDEVMKKEFLDTFKIIQENFKETFKELFKGGTCSLKLTDSNNILDTGIVIEACPPGKTLKSINLLSGGERTFTAISLLFAILKSRKVPFCIFDEVEAALDEVNVDAFGEYITKLKEKTQFIIITHKKRTMEFADILYGITMQESGVSKLVSVRLEDLK
ncbi:MAG: AAA family ATPase [bacterium]|nr:AAA family ATPase [bacterium]